VAGRLEHPHERQSDALVIVDDEDGAHKGRL
jgi:hypothetical protein